MARRTKREMEKMNNECRLYLFQTGLNYHKAYDLFVKDHLENGLQLPYYIKGIKDFKEVSEELAVELNKKEFMKKQDQQRAAAKDEIKKYIINLSKEDIKAIYKAYKDNVSHSDKLVIVDMYTTIWSDYKLTEKDIDQHMINVFSNIYRDQLQTA